jgi:superfamily I DNA/RNA helicase
MDDYTHEPYDYTILYDTSSVTGDGGAGQESDAPWLDGLNPDQFDVACHLDGPCLVIAGAGSGKTRSVVGRIQTLVRWYKVNPNDILAITFTRKAAREMRDRVHGALDEGEVEGLQVRTFHSVGVRVCRMFPDLLGLQERFSIWDEGASKRAFKEIFEEVFVDRAELGDPVVRTEIKKAWTPVKVLGLLNKMKERGEPLGAQYWTDLARSVHNGSDEATSIVKPAVADKVAGEDRLKKATLFWIYACERYEELKCAVNAVDLADLIWIPVTRARENPELQDALGHRWRYVIVDEYQDTNRLQEEFIGFLAGQHRNLMVVGDDDQAIYGWRGGDVRLITGFETRWDARVIQLGQNYRCRPEIVEIADRTIRRNNTRVSKELWSERGAGGAVDTRWYYDENHEVSRVAAMIQDKLATGVPGDEIAVLARRRRKVLQVANALTLLKVPVDAVGVKPWYEVDAVVNVLALLRYQCNPRDVDAARTILSAWPKIGAKTITRWWSSLSYGPRVLDQPLRDLLALPRHGVNTEKGKSIQRLLDLNQQVDDAIKANVPLTDVIQLILIGAGITKDIEKNLEGKQKDAEDAAKREAAIKSLILCADEVAARGYDAVDELSDNISTLVAAQDVREGKVSVSTIHAAKGLEWEHVIVAGCDQESLPSGDNIEEERRLFYVAATRAKEDLTFTWAIQARTQKGELVTTGPSPFLREAGLL